MNLPSLTLSLNKSLLHIKRERKHQARLLHCIARLRPRFNRTLDGLFY